MKHLILIKGTKNGASVAVQNVDFIRTGITDSDVLGGYVQMLYVDNRACDEAKIDVFSLEDQTKPVFTGTHQQLVEKMTYNPQSLLETLFHISYEMGFQKFYSGNIMADMATAIDLAKRFEQEHKDTDWDQEDWLSATSEFIEEEINKLKKEE